MTIITAVYNRASEIAGCLHSVANQTYPDVEHLVIDGASTDGTLEVIGSNAHDRMTMVSEPDEGIYDALNKGIRRASGEIVGLLHSDDVFSEDTVIEQVARSFTEDEVDCVYGDLDYVSAENPMRVVRRWRAGLFRRNRLRFGWMPPHPTLFVRKSLLEQCGLYDTSYRIAADYKLILTLFSRDEIAVGYVPKTLVKMRVGGESNRSLGQIRRKSGEDYRALTETGVGGAFTLAAKNLRKIGQFCARGRERAEAM